MLTQTLLAAALASVVNAAACPASFRVHPNGNTGYCLSVADPNVSGSVATVQPCNNSPGQTWTWEVQSYTDVVHLRNVGNSNGLCLAAEVYRVSGAYNGRQLAVNGCYNDGAQNWAFNNAGQIVMGGTVDGRQECIDVRDGNINGGAVQIWYCYDGNANQKWTIS